LGIPSDLHTETESRILRPIGAPASSGAAMVKTCAKDLADIAAAAAAERAGDAHGEVRLGGERPGAHPDLPGSHRGRISR